MKVKLIKFVYTPEGGDSLTIGKVYIADEITDEGVALIIEDDLGEPSALYAGEFELIGETK